MRMPYDPDNPPAEPPPGADRLSWQLAYQIRYDHRDNGGGFCMASFCRARSAAWPCGPARLAAAGLAGALGAWGVPWSQLNLSR